MLQSAGGARTARERHAQSGDYQSIRDIADYIRIARCDFIRLRHDFAQRGSNQLGDGFAIIFAGDQMRDSPFADADVFRHHIAESRPQHPHGRLRQNIRIQQYTLRTLIVQRNLHMIQLHR